MKKHSTMYISGLIEVLNNLDTVSVDRLKRKLDKLFRSKKTLFICGNGGSATTASHMASDLSKTILGDNPRVKQKHSRVISLNDNIAMITAWANDEGYNYIFSEQLKHLAKSGDMLIVITSSGNSANIIEVIKAAKELKISSFALLGFDGGVVKKIVDDYLHIAINDYGFVEDTHLMINHLLTDYFKRIYNMKNLAKKKKISKKMKISYPLSQQKTLS